MKIFSAFFRFVSMERSMIVWMRARNPWIPKLYFDIHSLLETDDEVDVEFV
jgi:hypothetical protein